ncbi:hypothetical protein LS684_02710 [Cytobacillus spongiae]|uniref:hypothetical protein n=1 Tax=Cytobacillus spongiae TaxID=2901381 RepID=UPI001F417FB8|nr:hypothetical protein [Cytobacillus spongiae]UII56415.1 hypothetical protein LS684_02710 [Cytobacillus spongiae]
MNVFLGNYSGETGGYRSAGGSCAIDTSGELIGRLEAHQEGLLVVSRESNQHKWKVKSVNM